MADKTIKCKGPRMQVEYPNCAGIDIAKDEHWVAIRPDAQGEQQVRRFDSFTEDIEQMAEWLADAGVEQVALEATGVYWIPSYEILERHGFDVWLINPLQTKRRDGRKSDVLDCQWIQQLMSYGLLSRSHRPKDVECELRGYVRAHRQLTRDRSRAVQHMQKALDQMNIRLDGVLSDITGKSGMAIIGSILEGERDGMVLAKLCDARVKSSEQQVAAALRGNWRDEHLMLLRQAWARYGFFSSQLSDLEDQVMTVLLQLLPFGEKPCRMDRQSGEVVPLCEKDLTSPARTKPHRQLQLMLWGVFGVDLTAIPSIGATTALTLLSEIGRDMSAFPTEQQFCSWLGLAPNVRISGGKRLSGGGHRRSQVAGQALRMAAMTLRFSESYLGAKHRARCQRLDPPRAIKASAHGLGRVIYAMITNGTEFVEKGKPEFDREHQSLRVRNLKRNAEKLGFTVNPLHKAA